MILSQKLADISGTYSTELHSYSMHVKLNARTKAHTYTTMVMPSNDPELPPLPNSLHIQIDSPAQTQNPPCGSVLLPPAEPWSYIRPPHTDNPPPTPYTRTASGYRQKNKDEHLAHTDNITPLKLSPWQMHNVLANTHPHKHTSTGDKGINHFPSLSITHHRLSYSNRLRY